MEDLGDPCKKGHDRVLSWSKFVIFCIDLKTKLEPGLRSFRSLVPEECFFSFGLGHKKRKIWRDACTK